MNFKNITQSYEINLSAFAFSSSASQGRQVAEQPCPIRTEFMRDRDRIIHCKAFRRLKHKTQVFLSPEGDHYRTRLTHTLEVAQIARTIARAVKLNEDLVESISLGHDLGHTPFGHTGERILDKLSNDFQHNKQSLRVVEFLENNGSGLNLTFEVKDGILNHKKNGNPSTLEGKVVSYADRIAYINHDIEDGMRAGILDEKDLPKAEILILGKTKSQRISKMVIDIVENSFDKPYVKMSDEIEGATNSLREFMFKNVYFNSNAKSDDKKAELLIEQLYNYYLAKPQFMPTLYLDNIDKFGINTAICDFISSMTDNYAVSLFESLFIPSKWNII